MKSLMQVLFVLTFFSMSTAALGDESGAPAQEKGQSIFRVNFPVADLQPPTEVSSEPLSLTSQAGQTSSPPLATN